MLHFEDDTTFTQPPAVVWSKLVDVQFLVDCIPDVQSVSHPEKGVAVCVIRPGFSFVRGTIDVTLKIPEAVENEKIRIHAHGKGIGSSNDVELTLNFSPQETGTRCQWTADVSNLTGLLKALPQGLIKGSAQKVINDVLAAVREKLAEG